MTFSMGTTPAAAVPLATASKTARKLPSGVRVDVAERGEDGVLGEGARFTGIGDDIGHGGGSLAARRTASDPVGRRRRRLGPPDRAGQPWRLNQSVVSISPASSSSSARRARAVSAGTGAGFVARVPVAAAASGAPRQCASASIALSATM